MCEAATVYPAILNVMIDVGKSSLTVHSLFEPRPYQM
jgi:hypothetical protein